MLNWKKLLRTTVAILVVSYCGRSTLDLSSGVFSLQATSFVYYWTTVLYLSSFLCFWVILLYGIITHRDQLKESFIAAKNFLASRQTTEILIIDSLMVLMFVFFWLPAILPFLSLAESLVVGMLMALSLFIYQVRRQSKERREASDSESE